MSKDNNKKQSYQKLNTRAYYRNRLQLSVRQYSLKYLSHKKHILNLIEIECKNSTPIRFYIYFVRLQRTKLEYISLR